MARKACQRGFVGAALHILWVQVGSQVAGSHLLISNSPPMFIAAKYAAAKYCVSTR